MAYAVEIDHECSEDGCAKRATRAVYTSRNEKVRDCCPKHAEALAAKLTAGNQ